MPGKENIIDVHRLAEKIEGDIQKVKSINSSNNNGVVGDPLAAARAVAQDKALDAMKNVANSTKELGKQYGVDVTKEVVQTPEPTNQEPSSTTPRGHK